MHLGFEYVRNLGRNKSISSDILGLFVDVGLENM